MWRAIADSGRIGIKVFYASRHGVEESPDPGFDRAFAWDVPMLEGYAHEFVPSARVPGLPGPASNWFPTGLGRRLSDGGFDAVLVHGYASGAAWSGTLAAKRVGIPVMLRGESHDRGRGRSFKQAVRRIALPRWLGHVDLVLAVGRLNRSMWLGAGVPPQRIIVSPYAIDNGRFTAALSAAPQRWLQLRQSWGVQPGQTVFLFSGKLLPAKDPALLMSAFSRLPEHCGAHLVFMGTGPLLPELKARALRSGVTRIHWAGFVNQSELPHYYRAADALVLPSRFEPWGVVVNEAMACGTPCIVSDMVGSGPDLVEAFDAGTVFPVRDEVALVLALSSALDPQRRQSWQKGLEDFRRRISLGANVDAIAEGLALVQTSHPARRH